MHYLIRRAQTPPTLCGEWDSPTWHAGELAQVNQFHARGSDHRPTTEARILYDDAGLYVSFRVHDRHVICRRGEHQTLTSKDSCVELYLQPFADRAGYFNFEMNCGGALLSFWVTDPTRIAQGVFKRKEVLPKSLIETMRIDHSMPTSVDGEVADAVTWRVAYFISNELLETYAGPLGAPAKREWRGNFFKCADESSHPHWASWSPIGAALNFHTPEFFAPITFEA